MIPDPNHPDTFERSRPAMLAPDVDEAADNAATARIRKVIALRKQYIVPRLEGARSLGAEAVGPAAVVARWHMGDGSVLTIAVNFGDDEVAVPAHRFHVRGVLIHSSPETDAPAPDGCLPPQTLWAMMEDATSTPVALAFPARLPQ